MKAWISIPNVKSIPLGSGCWGIPYDPLPVTETSGIRVGSPMLTTLGAVETDMARVVSMIDKAVSGENVNEEAHKFMLELAGRS